MKKNASNKIGFSGKNLFATTQRVSKQALAPDGEIITSKKFIPWGTYDLKGGLNTISKGVSSKQDYLN